MKRDHLRFNPCRFPPHVRHHLSPVSSWSTSSFELGPSSPSPLFLLCDEALMVAALSSIAVSHPLAVRWTLPPSLVKLMLLWKRLARRSGWWIQRKLQPIMFPFLSSSFCWYSSGSSTIIVLSREHSLSIRRCCYCCLVLWVSSPSFWSPEERHCHCWFQGGFFFIQARQHLPPLLELSHAQWTSPPPNRSSGGLRQLRGGAFEYSNHLWNLLSLLQFR